MKFNMENILKRTRKFAPRDGMVSIQVSVSQLDERAPRQVEWWVYVGGERRGVSGVGKNPALALLALGANIQAERRKKPADQKPPTFTI